MQYGTTVPHAWHKILPSFLVFAKFLPSFELGSQVWTWHNFCQVWVWLPSFLVSVCFPWVPSMTFAKFELGCQVSNLAAKFKLCNQVAKLKNLAKETNRACLKHVIYSKCTKNKKKQNSKQLCLALDVSIHGRLPAKHNSQLLSHMPLLSNLTTKQWGKLTKLPSTSLWFALAFLGMLSRLLLASTIVDNNRMRGGGGGGEKNGECLFYKNRGNTE